MGSNDLESLCALGQQQLMEMDYLAAEETLVAAERIALERREFDTLARLYMPLQESRRQRRQRCGEGMVRLDLISKDSSAPLDPEEIASTHPHGQLLVAGFASIEPALRVRQLQAQRMQYAETFLGATYPVGGALAVVIVPLAEIRLPRPDEVTSIDELIRKLPPHCVVLPESELPAGSKLGDAQTYAYTMSLWERLHAPFLAQADMQVNPMQKIEHYRKTIRVDYACELAHQKLAEVARGIARARGASSVTGVRS